MEPQTTPPAEAQDTTPSDNGPTWASRPLLIALGLFAVALLAMLVFVIRDSTRDVQLDATLLTLELSYPDGQTAAADLEVQAGAAPDGETITCRATDGGQRLGRDTARSNETIRIKLDPAPWPLDTLTGDGAATINDRVECRVGDGDWVHPLRQPRVRIN